MGKVTSTIFLLISGLIFSQDGEVKYSTIKDFTEKDIYVINVSAKANILTVQGYKDGNFVTDSLKLEKGQVFGIWHYGLGLRLSITTTPFKVRPSQKNAEQTVFTGLTNAGINVDIFSLKLDRYFITGNKSTHRFGIGFLLAPTAEELTPANSGLGEDEKYKQLFISAGLSVTYKYNDLTFSFIPVAWDYATSSVGKTYIYNEKRWWGFGIGISSELLGF